MIFENSFLFNELIIIQYGKHVFGHSSIMFTHPRDNSVLSY